MEPLQQAHYEQRFRITFLESKGDGFQALFGKLMCLAYKADFMPCRPWGRQGDHKNDGFLKSDRRLFQVYAPNELAATRAIKKITEDFEGAKAYWGTHFDKWTFVHNAKDGLPPHVQEVLLDFERDNPGVTLEPWGLEELLAIFRTLALEDLEGWLGFAPSERAKMEVGFPDLKIVLEAIANGSRLSPAEVKDVPPGKIEANALSDNVVMLLTAGMSKSPLVEDFFSRWHDESLGESVAESFRAKYESLRGDFLPDEIFSALQNWAGGSRHGSPKHEVAVLAVLAYYFNTCDIFEEPRASAQ